MTVARAVGHLPFFEGFGGVLSGAAHRALVMRKRACCPAIKSGSDGLDHLAWLVRHRITKATAMTGV